MTRSASVVEYTVAAEHADELHARVQQHLVPAARRVKGYQGFLLLDRGGDRRLAVLLFESVTGVQAAQKALTPPGRDYTYALMSSPALGSVATVVIADGIFAEPAES